MRQGEEGTSEPSPEGREGGSFVERGGAAGSRTWRQERVWSSEDQRKAPVWLARGNREEGG